MDLEAEILRLTKEVEGHAGQKTELDSKVAELEAQLSSVEGQKSELAQKLEAAESEVKTKVCCPTFRFQ